ncbi:hypothetical protein ACL1HZ_12035 [Corynebacterium striatum]
MRNIKDSSTREFVVPAGGGSLGSLLAASLDYEPVVVTRLQELIDSAGDAAERLSGAALSSACRFVVVGTGNPRSWYRVSG